MQAHEGSDSMARRVSRLPAALVPGVVASLRLSARFHEQPATGEQKFVGRFDGQQRVEVRRDGTLTYPDHPPLRAIIVQAIKGNLGPPRARFMLGIDEAGIGGESKQAQLALTMIGSETRADLIAEGVRDSKAVSSLDELARLAAVIRSNVPLHRVVPLPAPTAGGSYSKLAAEHAGKLLAELADAAQLPVELAIRVDNMDKATLLAALGDWREELEPRILIEPKADGVLNWAQRVLVFNLSDRSRSSCASRSSRARPRPSSATRRSRASSRRP